MKLVYGVGINDAGYAVSKYGAIYYEDGKKKQKTIWCCPFYQQWIGTLERCYSEKMKTKCPTYKDVICCEEWHIFSNFKRWMEQQDWKGKQLDKDIIIPDNKVYCPAACAFVLGATNKFITASNASRGDYLIGVSWLERLQKFQANCNNMFSGKMEYLGVYCKEADAHEAWRKRKHELAQLVAETESDPRVVEALKKRYSVEEWYKGLPQITSNSGYNSDAS